jgi:hypothetical protein
VIGAVLLFYVSTLTSFGNFYWLLLVYTLCYMPTLALTNSLSFHQMTDPGKGIPGVRVLGDNRLDRAGYAVDLLGFGKVPGCSISPRRRRWRSAFFSLVLPHTPPRQARTCDYCARRPRLDA